MKSLFAIVIGVSLLSAPGCAKAQHAAVVAEDVAHDGLMAFDRALDARCDAGELSAPTCKEINRLLVPVWDAKNALNRVIRADKADNIVTVAAQLREAIAALSAQVTALVPGAAKNLLLRELNLAVSQVP